MYLEKVYLKNYKAIEELEIDFQPGINLLVGDNGAGKTSVLDGIAIVLSGLFVNVEGVSAKLIAKEDVHVVVNEAGDNSKMVSYYEPVSVGCRLLHPKWQWNIIKALSVTFPNVQFIITTHSPIVISSAKEAHLVLLDEKKQVTYLPDSYGYPVEDVLLFRQESGSRPILQSK